MDVPTALLRDLLGLSAGVEGDDEVGPRLTALVGALRDAVSSFCGLDLTVRDLAHPVSLTSFLPAADDEGVATSLRVPLGPVSSGSESRSQVILYATRPGALVDLAADLRHILREAPLLDADLPPRTVVSGLSGLSEMTAINRAVGMLIEQGNHPDVAHAKLVRDAGAAGVDPHVYAARLLGR